MAAATDANCWVGLEIEHPTSVTPVLSYQPERVAVDRTEDRRVSHGTRSPASRLHQRHARWRDPGSEQATNHRIERVPSDEDLNAALHRSIGAIRHSSTAVTAWATVCGWRACVHSSPPRSTPPARKCSQRSLACPPCGGRNGLSPWPPDASSRRPMREQDTGLRARQRSAVVLCGTVAFAAGGARIAVRVGLCSRLRPVRLADRRCRALRWRGRPRGLLKCVGNVDATALILFSRDADWRGGADTIPWVSLPG